MRPFHRRTVRFAILMAAIAAVGCGPRSEPVTMEDVRSGEGPDQESWGVDMLLTEDGSPRLRLFAAYAAWFEEEAGTYMLMSGSGGTDSSRVRAIVFGADGDTTATVLADVLRWYESERRIEARGDVVVIGTESRRLEAEHLDWLEQEHEVTTPGFARYSSPGRELEGYGLRADEHLDNVSLSNVTGSWLFEDG